MLTNTSGYLGAAGLLLENLLADFAEMIEDNFFVIPSSIHEALLISGGSEMDIESLNEIIRTVNISQVSPHEVLSDHAYYYDRKIGQLQTELIRKKQQVAPPANTGAQHIKTVLYQSVHTCYNQITERRKQKWITRP